MYPSKIDLNTGYLSQQINGLNILIHKRMLKTVTHNPYSKDKIKQSVDILWTHVYKNQIPQQSYSRYNLNKIASQKHHYWIRNRERYTIHSVILLIYCPRA